MSDDRPEHGGAPAPSDKPRPEGASDEPRSLAVELRRISAQLSQRDRRIIEEYEEAQRNVARRLACTAIMARNFSHGGGSHVVPQPAAETRVEGVGISSGAARTMAHAAVRSLHLSASRTPQDALRRFPWDIGRELAVDQRQIALWNLELDGRSCLGRVAQAAAIVELQFPSSVVTYAEVLSDHLRQDMLAQVHEGLPRDAQLRDEWLQEVLLYEEPHAVITVDGEQFDPLSTVYPVEIHHPRVQPHPLWDGVASAMTVAEASLACDPAEKLRILDQAERRCPGTTLVAENTAEPLVLLGRTEDAVATLSRTIEARPCARTLFVLATLTGDAQYRRRLDEEYTPFMLPLLEREAGL